MRQYTLFAFLCVLTGCATAKLELGDLPQPVYVSASDGTTYMSQSSENPPANALAYSQVDSLIRNTTGNTYTYSGRYKNYTQGESLALDHTFNNIYFLPGSSSYFSQINYAGDRFVANQYGFAEQETGEIKNGAYHAYSSYYSLGFSNTKLVLGGGTAGLNYVDFGYWIGVPKDTSKRVLYSSFAGHPYFNTQTPNASTSYTGQAAAVAFDNSVAGSARELGGIATLTLNTLKNTHLNLVFQNYYTFDIYAANAYGTSGVNSVLVSGTNTNGGPAFTSCASGCTSNADVLYFYSGQYDAAEAAGTYSYTSGNSNLIGSFGAALDH